MEDWDWDDGPLGSEPPTLWALIGAVVFFAGLYAVLAFCPW